MLGGCSKCMETFAKGALIGMAHTQTVRKLIRSVQSMERIELLEVVGGLINRHTLVPPHVLVTFATIVWTTLAFE